MRPEVRGRSGGRRIGSWRRLLVLVLVLGTCGLAAGAGWGVRQERVHEASAVVLVNPLDGNPFRPDGRGDDLVNLETEAQLVRSDVMGDLVTTALGRSESNGSVLDGVSVVVPANTQLLEITTRTTSDASAIERAQAFADAYLAYRRSRAESAVADQVAQVSQQIRERNEQRSRLVTDLGPSPGSSTRSTLLVQQVITLTTQVGELRAQLGELESAPTDPGQVVTPALATPHGLPGGATSTAVLGLVLGGGLGLLLALGLTRFDDRIRDPGELTGAGNRLLGTLPSDPGSDHVAVAHLRAALLAADPRRPLVVLVTAPTADSSHALATSLAASHLMTVVVQAHGNVGGGGEPGSSQGPGVVAVLQDRATLSEALVSCSPYLSWLPLGGRADQLDDLAAAPEMAVLLADLRHRVDVVLLACGPSSSPRTQALAAAADVVIIEVRAGVTTWRELAAASDDLLMVGAERVHLVFVQHPRRRLTPTRVGRRVRGRILVRSARAVSRAAPAQTGLALRGVTHE